MLHEAPSPAPRYPIVRPAPERPIRPWQCEDCGISFYSEDKDIWIPQCECAAIYHSLLNS